MTEPRLNGNSPSFSAMVHWLTGAYPEGLPAEDRSALINFLLPRLSREQIYQALVLLTPPEIEPGSPRLLARDDVDLHVQQSSDQPPPVPDQRRVASRLARAGWPLAGGI